MVIVKNGKRMFLILVLSLLVFLVELEVVYCLFYLGLDELYEMMVGEWICLCKNGCCVGNFCNGVWFIVMFMFVIVMVVLIIRYIKRSCNGSK